MQRVIGILILSAIFWPGPLAGDRISIYEYLFDDRTGQEITLDPYRGRVLVLEFFATWCPPCRKDLPKVASLQKEFNSDEVTFLAISADGPSKTVVQIPDFLKETQVEIPVLIGGDVFVDEFTGIEQKGGRQIVLPQTYVFDGEGELQLRFVGESHNKIASLTSELKRLIEKPEE